MSEKEFITTFPFLGMRRVISSEQFGTVKDAQAAQRLLLSMSLR